MDDTRAGSRGYNVGRRRRSLTRSLQTTARPIRGKAATGSAGSPQASRRTPEEGEGIRERVSRLQGAWWVRIDVQGGGPPSHEASARQGGREGNGEGAGPRFGIGAGCPFRFGGGGGDPSPEACKRQRDRFGAKRRRVAALQRRARGSAKEFRGYKGRGGYGLTFNVQRETFKGRSACAWSFGATRGREGNGERAGPRFGIGAGSPFHYIEGGVSRIIVVCGGGGGVWSRR